MKQVIIKLYNIIAVFIILSSIWHVGVQYQEIQLEEISKNQINSLQENEERRKQYSMRMNKLEELGINSLFFCLFIFATFTYTIMKRYRFERR